MRDCFHDDVSYPSTFCLRMSEEFAQGYPSDEEWHGYINNNDRVLLKVNRYSAPTSAGAECLDPDCTWVEQCLSVCKLAPYIDDLHAYSYTSPHYITSSSPSLQFSRYSSLLPASNLKL
ncbi:hypothetical protein L2E82_38972 [Cichorium intybus]|uniref:Uncharacterized protein n=1 Tax=Cichorium intybus TaxID=13427 RepID=A0ACB9AH95_CICIN|nr:hypothetical protein L2E82_38972 [Cichorium intybus]